MTLQPKAPERSSTGILADAEARRLTTTSFSLPKEQSAAIDVVVGHPDTAYTHRGDFIRHAVLELLWAWVQAGFPSEFVKDETEHIRAMRTAAYQLRRRQDFAEILTIYEVSLAEGSETGDWGLVTDTLGILQGYIDRTRDRHWQEHLRKAIARSPSTQAAVNGLYEASRDESKLRKEARHWNRWLESLQ